MLFSAHTFTMNSATAPQELAVTGDIPETWMIKANAAGFYIGGTDLTVTTAGSTGFPLIPGKEYTFKLGPPDATDGVAAQSMWVVTTSATDVSFSFIVMAG